MGAKEMSTSCRTAVVTWEGGTAVSGSEASRARAWPNFSCPGKQFGFYLKGNREPTMTLFKGGADLIGVSGRSLLPQREFG